MLFLEDHHDGAGRFGNGGGKDLDRIIHELIAKAASLGDEIAKRIYIKAGYDLGVAVINVYVSIGCPPA